VSTIASFQRNIPGFTDHLSRLLTQTITHHPLVYKILPGGGQALIRFREDDAASKAVYVPLKNDCSLCVLQRVGAHPDPEEKDKLTTLEYLYAFRIGRDPAHEPLVRYEYVPEQAASGNYPYPKGHVHLSAEVPEYAELIAPHENKPLHQVHFPTGRITLEDFIELPIVEFHVPTHSSKEDALALLEASRRIFLEEKKTKD
jgi:hypothetical protein